ncbi:hypothetical protein ABZ312_09715 [Streptomyces sp. NPDC006207]
MDRYISSEILDLDLTHRPPTMSPEFFDSLVEEQARLRVEEARLATLTPAQRREESLDRWTTEQREIDRYMAQAGEDYARTEKAKAERGREENRKEAAAVLSRTCMGCFQVPSRNGVCGC